MSINHIGPEEISRRKVISDLNSNTDDLTIPTVGNTKSKYSKISNKIDKIDMRKLFDDSDYFEEMFNSL